MSSSEPKNAIIPNKTSYTKIEVDDLSGYFISYWNLALKKQLKDYFVTINSGNSKPNKIPLSELNINLMNVNNSFLENKSPLIYEEKLFIIKIYFLSSEKELNNDFYENIKQSYDKQNLNLVLYLISEVKDNSNILKDSTKLLNKIKSKSGLNDLTILPYNIVFFDKLQPAFSPFIEFFSEKFSNEFLNKYDKVTKKIESYNEDNYISINSDSFKYIEYLICYFDLLSLTNDWNSINYYCSHFLYKELTCLKKEYIFENFMSLNNYNDKKMKINFKNEIMANVEFQEYIFNYYIKSCQYLEKYEYIIQFIKYFPYNMESFSNNFKTEYHYIFWILHYLSNLINFFISLHNYPNCKIINEGFVVLYSLYAKFLKLYAYKSKRINIPDKSILIKLINCIKNKSVEKIGDEMKNYLNITKENNIDNKNLNSFIDDYKNKKDEIYMILTDNNKYLEHLLSILNNINKCNKELLNYETSINCAFDITYLLISFCKFEETKDFLINLLNYKFLNQQKLKYIYEYICFIILLVLNFINKTYDNLNIIFKLLNIKYLYTDELLNNLSYESKNLINEILSQYLESINPKELKEKNEIHFFLDKVLNIKLFDGENKTLFINKAKSEKEKLNYKITNNSGVELDINKINLIFEENDNKNSFIYIIDKDKNNFKKIEPYMDDKKYFDLEFSEIFKLNTIYKLAEIQFVMNNDIKGIYRVKENIEILFSELNINIKNEIYSSYDSPDIKNDNFYYNILCMIKVNILNVIDINELKNKAILVEIIDTEKNNDSILKIQTELLKSILKPKIPQIIINDLSIELPPNSINDINDINILDIPFFYENTNYYTNAKNRIKIKITIQEKKDSINNTLFSYYSIHKLKLSHLFTIGKRFKLLKNDSYLLQTFLSLNIETTKVKVYNSNNVTNIDSKQAINMLLLLNDNEHDILNKLRNNFMIFSLLHEDNIKHRFCYPEKNILDEIKEMKEIPYHIIINIINDKFELLNEIFINVCIKKYKEKKVKLMIKINDNNNWSVVGKNKIIEEFGEEKGEKNLKIGILPLNDGYLQLPQIEFNEYEIDGGLNFNFNDDKNNNRDDNLEEFEPIEYGSVIEGDKNVLRIEPLKEYNLKINLT